MARGLLFARDRPPKVTDRAIAMLNDISFTAIKRRELTDKDWERFAAKSAENAGLKFTLIEAAGWSVSDITSAAEAYDFDVIFIDYVQLIRPSTTNPMRSEQVAEISRELHAFAQNRKKLVIELAQLIREERPAMQKKGEQAAAERTAHERPERVRTAGAGRRHDLHDLPPCRGRRL